MKSKPLIIGGIILLALILGGFWAYDWILGDTKQASAPISAPTIDLAAEPSATEEMLNPTPTKAEQREVESQSNTNGSKLTIFQINQAESQVLFNIFEELRGAPKDVIGVSNQVAGQVAVDFDDLSRAQVGLIQINARTLETDDNRRNQAIRNRILFTDQYEFITFEPTEIIGLSGSAKTGQTYNFQIVGNMTIRDITIPAVFDATVTMEGTDRLVGSATTTINRDEFNLVVPDLSFIANVSEDILLQIDFVLTSS